MYQWDDHIKAIERHMEEINKSLGPQGQEFKDHYQQILDAAAGDSIEPKYIDQQLIRLYANFPALEEFLKQAEPKLFENGTLGPPEELAPVHPITKPPYEEAPAEAAKSPPEITPPVQPQPRVPPPREVAQNKTESGLQVFKEIVTAFLAVVLVIFTLIMANHTMGLAGDNTKISQAKDILLLLLAPFGTVLGYYFGRLPADARAAQAQQQAARTAVQAEQVNAQAIQVAERAEELTGELEKAPGVRGIPSPAIEKAQRLRLESRELLRLARRI
ncbi:MAG TPA: hypothetical protein VEF33_06305 [Syntrophales bacterium]|nr:hypothetical protein [Syntrophales bacterium]